MTAYRKKLIEVALPLEYRSSDASGPAQEREEHRCGFFTFYDELWNKINLRNDNQPYQGGLFVLNIRTFAERSVREVILNAVSHRNYQLGGSVFVRQFPRRLEVVRAHPTGRTKAGRWYPGPKPAAIASESPD